MPLRRRLPYTRDHLPPIDLAEKTGLTAPDTPFNRRAAAYAAAAVKVVTALAAAQKARIKKAVAAKREK